MRAIALACALLVAGGCAATTNGRPDRSLARKVLIGLAIGTAGLAIGAAVAGNGVESRLRDDVAAGTLTGREFADRDAGGRRWNRVARASTFAFGLSLIGLGVLWEMSEGDRIQLGPPEKTAASDQRSTTAR